MKKFLAVPVVAIFFLLIISGLSFAQEQYGHIRGKVTDSNKEPLPGVTVTLECPLYGKRSATSSSGGIFRFLNLPSSTYSLKCELLGFTTYVEENIIIRVGNNFDFPIVLEQASLEEEITVVATSPIVDTKNTGTVFNVTEAMLQEVPSVRDPWDILKQVPGVFVNTENVGGIDSGSMPDFRAKGAPSRYFGNFNLDGISVNEMTPNGNSNRYYDFDSLEEIQIVTSGQDPSIKTGGVSVNMVTRRGSNKFGALARIFLSNEKLQSDNRTQELIDDGLVGDHIHWISDYGIQLGGPIVRDKLWFWAGYGVQDIQLLTIDGYPNDTKIESLNAKLNFQLSPKDRGELAFVYNDKTVFNQNVNFYKPPEATVNVTSNGNPLVKFEYERTFSDTFLMTVKLAHSWGWTGEDPNGGFATQAGRDLYDSTWFGTTNYLRVHMPSYSAQINANLFLEDFLAGDHEFKFGAEYRLTPQNGEHIWPGGVIRRYWNGEPLEAIIHRCLFDRTADRYSFYVNDAYSRGRLTFNFGMRIDRENFWNKETEVPAHPLAPEIMPGFTMPRIDPGAVLWTFSPRFGLTFDLIGDGKTVLRANAARYGLWPDNLASIMSVTEENVVYYDWEDLNGDDLVSKDELVGYPDGFTSYSGYNIFDPTNPVSPYEIADDLPTGLTDELLFGVEREIFRDFSLSANITLRRLHSWNRWVRFNRETGQKDNRQDWGDPIQGSITIGEKTYEYEYWASQTPRNELPNQIFESWPNWHANYTGFEIIATKRLSHRWMMNASITYEWNIEHYGEGSYTDPTNIDKLDGADGDSTRWMAKFNFLYQLPWGINLSGFAYIRQGKRNNQYVRVLTPERRVQGWGSAALILVEKPGETRLPTFYNINLGLFKDIILGRAGRITLHVDAFNVFNFNHVLGSNGALHSKNYGRIGSILNPRVIRLGVRYRF